ncbi:MAG: AMP-binding protein [Gammaproteobacteria bacterium]|jgi:acyl-coenzyme A synthetase/AMP-(fatty) acid ligase
MPKTIAITPSWYWPEHVERVIGIPPLSVPGFCVYRHGRDRPDDLAVVHGDQRLSFGELLERVERTSACLDARADGGERVVLGPLQGIDGITLLLAALTSSAYARVLGVEEDAVAVAAAFGSSLNVSSAAELGGEGTLAPDIWSRTIGNAPVLCIPGTRGSVSHTHRSLLAGAISLATFFHLDRSSSWVSALPLSGWDGVLSALIPLSVGAPLVIVNGDDDAFAEAIQREEAQYGMHDLEGAVRVTREARRGVRKARDVLSAMLLTVNGPFDPGDRQRVARQFRCSALTLFGLPETGPIFASHPQWYLDESVGIPVTNAHVVPADPRSGAPIRTLWELVESAEVTVKGPALMCDASDERFVDGRFRTGVRASSDANGMIYLLPD